MSDQGPSKVQDASRTEGGWLILADDLSGAADCAVGAARSGLESVVLWGLQTQARPEQVVAIDADTRYAPAARAAERQAGLWQLYTGAGAPPRRLYKKIDSTLRGNFAAEMAALRAAGVAIVASAYVAAGRTVVDGRVLVQGRPLEASEVWAHEGLRGEAHLPTLLEAQGLRCAHLPLSLIRSALAQRLDDLLRSGQVDAIVCDSETEADLQAIAQATVGLPVYWVGSAGLIAHLPVAADGAGQGRLFPARVTVQGAVLTVVGSLSSVSRTQAARLAAQAPVRVVSVAAELLRVGETHALWPAVAAQVADALGQGHDLLIQTESEAHTGLLHGPALTQALGRLIGPWADAVGALIATGGETAHGLLPFLGATGLRIVREIEAGAPLSLALGPRAFPVVTKAGAFGHPDTLLHCHTELAALRPAATPSLSEHSED
ncbi:MAG: four-carbon acid sugar kinase family protein [Curvibacter sp.]|nr:four-carbon acid sugar kinase family protein [Curvibacter sp.]